MDLFSTGLDENQNCPKTEPYFIMGHMMPIQDANFYLENLLETIPWKNDEAVIFGKLIITKEGRLVWDTTFSYTYSKRTKQALIWTPNCWR
jgi:hypothetical protein